MKIQLSVMWITRSRQRAHLWGNRSWVYGWLINRCELLQFLPEIFAQPDLNIREERAWLLSFWPATCSDNINLPGNLLVHTKTVVKRIVRCILNTSRDAENDRQSSYQVFLLWLICSMVYISAYEVWARRGLGHCHHCFVAMMFIWQASLHQMGQHTSRKRQKTRYLK